jgi:D-glycero-D-manno-heptose 1,7-bisphosphate phosphatase
MKRRAHDDPQTNGLDETTGSREEGRSLMRPAVFVDRDGTLIEERRYLDRLEQIELFPWTPDAVRLLNRAGFAVVVITNQSGVARGMIDERFVGHVHAALDARLAAGNATIDRYYFCPHHPDALVERYRCVCSCRKPGPGMIERACREMAIDLQRSVTVGDKWLDVACGQAAGTRSILVRTGYGAEEEPHPPEGARADVILNNLMEAAGWILRNRPGSPSSSRPR